MQQDCRLHKTQSAHPVVQEKLQQADQEKTDEVQSAKSEVQGLHALLTSLKAELTEQKQVVEAQQSKLQAASGLKTQLTELEGQLEEQKKVIAAKEELTKKNFAPKKEQAQEVASMKARLAEVCAAPVVTSCDSDVL